MALPLNAHCDQFPENETSGNVNSETVVEDVQKLSSAEPPLGCSNAQAVDTSFSTLMGLPIASAITQKQLAALAPLSLAYIGDAVFELYVRSRLLMPSKRIRDYHQQVVNQVKAEQQSCYVDTLLPYLNEAERDVVRRGRNATTGRNRRAKGQDYQKATGLEALVGFLYLSDPDRLMTLLNQLQIS